MIQYTQDVEDIQIESLGKILEVLKHDIIHNHLLHSESKTSHTTSLFNDELL